MHPVKAMKKNPKSIAEFVDDLQQKGRYTFTKSELKRAIGESDVVLKLSL